MLLPPLETEEKAVCLNLNDERITTRSIPQSCRHVDGCQPPTLKMRVNWRIYERASQNRYLLNTKLNAGSSLYRRY